jgi:phage terminase large subunit-like protein
VDLCDRYYVQAVACDLRGFRRSVEILEARGVPVVEAPHSPPRLVECSATLDGLIAEGKLIHDGDPTTRRQMLAALKKTNQAGERYIPADSARAVVAIAVAVHHGTAPMEELRMILPSGAIG